MLGITCLCADNGSQLTGEAITTNGSAETLYGSYDAGGTAVSCKDHNTHCFYETRLQGNVAAIMNAGPGKPLTASSPVCFPDILLENAKEVRYTYYYQNAGAETL